MPSRAPTRTAVLAAAAALGLAALGLSALGLAVAGPARAVVGPGIGAGPGLLLTVGGTHAARLLCEPAPHGTHPFAREVCAELDAAGGDFDALPGEPGVCHDEYAPVIATA